MCTEILWNNSPYIDFSIVSEWFNQFYVKLNILVICNVDFVVKTLEVGYY